MIASHGRGSSRGFSLLELLIVIAMIMAVAAIAIPQALTAMQTFRLRGAASSLSGVVQKCRMLAVARNARCPTTTCTSTGYFSVAAINSGATVFVDLDASGTINQPDENTTVLQLPAGMWLDTSGAHPSDASINSGLTAINAALPRFNPRGLPCFGTAPCSINPANIYIAYIRQDRSVGGTGWAAVTVTPAGRVQVFTWDGSRWQ